VVPIDRSTKDPPNPSDPPEVKVQVTPPAAMQSVAEAQVSAFATPAKQNATVNITANIKTLFIRHFLRATLTLDAGLNQCQLAW
jgi:hypothetical protein